MGTNEEINRKGISLFIESPPLLIIFINDELNEKRLKATVFESLKGPIFCTKYISFEVISFESEN